MTNNKYGIRPGDIFYTSWGYDQTNVNYYLVTRVTACKAEVTAIGAHVVEANGPGGNRLAPDPTHLMEYDVLIASNQRGAPIAKLCSVQDSSSGWGEVRVVLSRDHSATRWHDGSLQYATDIMFGR